MTRWHQITKNNNSTIINGDDATAKQSDFKNFNNNELFLHRLTTTSPAESIVSAPLTPTGNLIVNILSNLDNHQQTGTDLLNRRNYRNSTNCVIERNELNERTTNSTIHKIPAVTLAEHRYNGQTKTIPITSKASKTTSNGIVQCVTIAINNNDTTDTVLHCDDTTNTIKLNNLYCNRSYSLSSSAPQCINYWNGPTT